MGMRRFVDYLDNRTLGQGSLTPNFVLENAKIDKASISRLADKLNNRSSFSQVSVSYTDPNGVISYSSIRSIMESFQSTFNSYFEQENNISLLLENSINILTSEIADLEKELDVLEKGIENYAFLLADGNAYDYVFMETFSDDRFQESGNLFNSDRAGLSFGPGMRGVVDAGEGVLRIYGRDHRRSLVANREPKTNASSHITSKSPLANALDNSLSSGWRMSCSAPKPIASTLDDFKSIYHGAMTGVGGFQVVLEVSTSSPTPCNKIQIDPMIGSEFEVSQIVLYSNEEETEFIEVLQESKEVSAKTSFYFNTFNVKKVKLFLRRSEYTRDTLVPISSEEVNKQIHDEFKLGKSTTQNHTVKSRGRSNQSLQSVLLLRDYLARGSKDYSQFKVAFPKFNLEKSWGSFSKTIAQLKGTSVNQDIDIWDNKTAAGRQLVRGLREIATGDMLEQFFGDVPARHSEYADLYRAAPRDTRRNAGHGSLVDAPLTSSPDSGDNRSSANLTYDYELGIRTLNLFFVSDYASKSVFVSKILPAKGNVGEVKLREKSSNHFVWDINRDSNQVTSVEYSVTNNSNPTEESHWVPILPSNNLSGNITAERFFPDPMGKGYFRFPADPNAPIILYKNGFQVEYPIEDMQLPDDRKFRIRGLWIPFGEFTDQDIFTVDYLTDLENSVISFADSDSLVSSFDKDGAGEGFNPLSSNLRISLTNTPYIDYDQVLESTYSTTSGLYPYVPVTIQLEDGTLATNLTNYKTQTQTALDPTSSLVQFVHSGSSILFNKVVDQKFRVYYKYLPSSIRVRTVLRSSEYGSFVTPKVDYFQLKAKTRKPDIVRGI